MNENSLHCIHNINKKKIQNSFESRFSIAVKDHAFELHANQSHSSSTDVSPKIPLIVDELSEEDDSVMRSFSKVVTLCFLEGASLES
eukprot:m.59924 g.59924  ORF g.59924 m.59924 type:complete len:87 (-) comp13254_c1_seq2:1994-2254(-)